MKKTPDLDPNAAANVNNGIYGPPVKFGPSESQIILLPVPWEVTTSFRPGTANGPEAIIAASNQVELFDPFFGEPWKVGIYIDDEIISRLKSINKMTRPLAEKCIAALCKGKTPSKKLMDTVNTACAEMVELVRDISLQYLNQHKIVGLVGGDHSTPLGLIKALSKKHSNFSILHIDAHRDLRKSYEGFKYSHASIMYNVLEETSVKNIVQVGIRDEGTDEKRLFHFDFRLTGLSEKDMRREQFTGETWGKQVPKIISMLRSRKVYVSFDIDGLKQQYCPNTGTPVPGGLEFAEAIYLLEQLSAYEVKVIGFDLNEVSPGNIPKSTYAESWDANVGARVLYKLCGLAAKTNNLKEIVG